MFCYDCSFLFSSGEEDDGFALPLPVIQHNAMGKKDVSTTSEFPYFSLRQAKFYVYVNQVPFESDYHCPPLYCTGDILL